MNTFLIMADGRRNNGGNKNAGRKPKADEKKVNTLFVNALKLLYNKETDDEAKIHFIQKVLLESQRGQIFVAEHIFGKPKETVENIHTLPKPDKKVFTDFNG